MDANRDSMMEGREIGWLIVIASALFVSMFFSVRSLTGYAVNETINGTANWTSFIYFMLGIVGAYFLFKIRREKKVSKRVSGGKAGRSTVRRRTKRATGRSSAVRSRSKKGKETKKKVRAVRKK
jgi:uncharacterized membrane protein YuzA (DUF378 family)